MDAFISRCLILRFFRRFYDGQDYFEVETPVLNPKLGGALLDLSLLTTTL